MVVLNTDKLTLLTLGTNRLLKYLKTNHGIVVQHIDTTDVQVVKACLTPRTSMVLLETPTNPLIKIVDLPTIARIAHEISPECLVVVDNTMMSPYLMNPLQLGADIVYESGTKYLSGHHDLMAGVIAVKDAALGNVSPFPE
jgi:cystathionine beta-lyase